MEQEIQLNIIGLVYNQTVVGTYGLVLSEASGNRRFSVMIGEPEAQSIALKLNNKKSPRPLTHDLIHNILGIFSAKLDKIVIYNMVNDVFYSELHIRTANGVQVVDARTSDAVALAVRSDSPVFIRASILDIVGSAIDNQQETVAEEEDAIDAESLTVEDLDALSEEDLQQLLEMSLKEEKYELAVNIRDALKRKENK